jgi:hypothetical protein
MKNRIIVLVTLMLVASSYFVGNGECGCGYSSGGGSASNSVINNFMNTRASYESSEKKTTYVFVKQTGSDWYAKVCNDQANIEDFMQHQTNGCSWGNCVTISSSEIQNYAGRKGIFRFESASGGNIKVCECR